MKVVILTIIVIFAILAFLPSFGYSNVDKFTSPTSDNIYVIRTHVLDKQFLNLWTKCLNELPKSSLYIIFDNTKSALTQKFKQSYNNHIITLTQEEAISMNPLHSSMWYSVDTSLAKCEHFFKERHISYKYMWFLENDIYCDGNMYTTLQKANGLSEDFLAISVEKQSAANLDWHWWQDLVGRITSHEERVKSLFPVTRCSRELVQAVCEELGKSSGYCEVYIPTLASLYKLTYANLPISMIGEGFTYQLLPKIFVKHNDTLHHKFVLGKTQLSIWYSHAHHKTR